MLGIIHKHRVTVCLKTLFPACNSLRVIKIIEVIRHVMVSRTKSSFDVRVAVIRLPPEGWKRTGHARLISILYSNREFSKQQGNRLIEALAC